MTYFLAVNGQHEGPFDIEQLRQHGVTPESLVWNNTMTNWTPAGQVPEIAQALFCNNAVPPRQEYRQPPYQPGYQQSGYQQSGYQQPGYQQQAQYNTAPGEMPSTYLVWAILVTLLCCLPCGIVSIVYASKVESLWNQGLYDQSFKASNNARNWAIGGAIASAVCGVLYVILYATILGMAL